MNNTLVTLIVLIIFLLIGGIVIAVIRATVRTAERRRESARMVGFTPVQPDAALTGRISQIHHTEPGSYRLENLFHKRVKDSYSGSDLYLFDLIEEHAGDTSYPENQALAVFSPELHMPRFTLVPKVEEEGAPGRLANQVVRWVIARSAPPLDFPDMPDFQVRYLVSAPDPSAAQAFFSPTLRRRLAGTQMYMIKAYQDGFIFSIFARQGTIRPEELNRQVNGALELLKWFQDAVPREANH